MKNFFLGGKSLKTIPLYFQVADLLDMVLDSFIKRSVTGGLGSIQAEIMADTAVALTSANVQLVSRKVIGRLCRVRYFPFLTLFHSGYQ